MPVIAVIIIGAALLLWLILRGSGEANGMAEQQEAELLQGIQDAEAMQRITSR